LTDTSVIVSATYFFFGGLLQFIAGLLEWVLGNTFPSVVFCCFGAFFFSFGGTLNPSFGAYAAYAPAGEPASAGLATQGFNASFGETCPPSTRATDN
jgi:succinate-acetate transporter protein